MDCGETHTDTGKSHILHTERTGAGARTVINVIAMYDWNEHSEKSQPHLSFNNKTVAEGGQQWGHD